MSVLPDLDASYTDHRRYGVLEAGVNEPTVWIAYDCRASRARRVNEDDHAGRNWTGRRAVAFTSRSRAATCQKTHASSVCSRDRV